MEMLEVQRVDTPANPAYTPHLCDRIERDFIERWNRVWGGRSLVHGLDAGPDAVRLNGNDYLNVTGHPHIVQAQSAAIRRDGEFVIQSGSFLLETHPVRAFEKRMAHWVGKDDGVLCQSGYAANVGLLQCIADEKTPVYIDMLAHMSLWEGARRAEAPTHAFRHNDVAHLQRLMERHGPGLVIVDSVYSTTGSVAPLVEIVDAAEAAGSMILVDESHSLGVYGPDGAGMVVEQGLHERVHFRTASLSKAFAARGGLVLCSDRLAEYLRYQSLPAIFSSSLLPHEIAGLDATIGVIQRASARRERVRAHGRHLRARLRAIGYDVGADETQIIALVAGPEHLTIQLRDALEARGIFGSVFCDPATPRNRSLVRFTLGADHDRAEIDRIADVCAEIRPHLSLDQWPGARRQAQQVA